MEFAWYSHSGMEKKISANLEKNENSIEKTLKSESYVVKYTKFRKEKIKTRTFKEPILEWKWKS